MGNYIRKRIEWIDGIRALGIFCVVLCHCVEVLYQMNTDFMAKTTFISELFAVICFSAGRCGVPFFLMISGYLLLDRKYTSKDALLFYKKNCWHLFLCTEIWIVIYNCFYCISNNSAIDIKVLLEELLFLRPARYGHLWYMPMIIGFYLLIPFVANALQTLNHTLLIVPLIIYFIYSSFYPLAITILSTLKIDHPLRLQFSFGFSGGMYGIYLILGYLIKKGWLRKITTNFLLLIIIIAFGLTVVFQTWVFDNGGSYNLWYNFPMLCVFAVSVFELFSRFNKLYLYKVIRIISYYSFAIYLIHNVFRSIFLSVISGIQIGRPIKVVMLYVLVTICSFITSWIIKCIPKFGKYILYIK